MRFIKLVCIVLLLSACAPIVNVDYVNDVNFKSYQTFSHDIKVARIDSDTRVSSPFMQQRLIAAIKTTLTKNGYKQSKSNASLQVRYFLDVKQEIETQESTMMIGFSSSHAHSGVAFGFNFPAGEVYSVDSLVLTIDMVSVKTNKLIWRGSSSYYLSNEGTPEKYEKMIKDLVTIILNKFPPK